MEPSVIDDPPLKIARAPKFLCPTIDFQGKAVSFREVILGWFQRSFEMFMYSDPWRNDNWMAFLTTTQVVYTYIVTVESLIKMLVGGRTNQVWKICSSNWIISPRIDENKKCLKTHHLVELSAGWDSYSPYPNYWKMVKKYIIFSNHFSEKLNRKPPPRIVMIYFPTCEPRFRQPPKNPTHHALIDLAVLGSVEWLGVRFIYPVRQAWIDV